MPLLKANREAAQRAASLVIPTAERDYARFSYSCPLCQRSDGEPLQGRIVVKCYPWCASCPGCG